MCQRRGEGEGIGKLFLVTVFHKFVSENSKEHANIFRFVWGTEGVVEHYFDHLKFSSTLPPLICNTRKSHILYLSYILEQKQHLGDAVMTFPLEFHLGLYMLPNYQNLSKNTKLSDLFKYINWSICNKSTQHQINEISMQMDK